MTDTPLRLAPEDPTREWAFYVNPIVRLLRGVTTGGAILRGDLGTRRDLVDPNTVLTGRYTIESQSQAVGGLHAAFPLSGTSLTATPTAANSAALITDTGITLGSTAGLRLDLETIRVYEAGRVDYSQATSSNGELVLGGSGASAGGLALASQLRMLNGSAIQLFNVGNTLAGQIVADANGNLVTGGSGTPSGSLHLNGHLQFLLTTGARISGDLSNATIASRLIFQTTTANSGTLVSAMPLGAGNAGGFVAYNNSTPASASGAAVIQATSTEVQVRADSPGASYLPLTVYTSNTERLRITPAGMVLVNDTTNANMTLGLTINQAGNDDEILAAKSSDVSHSATALAEADTYLSLNKASATDGGAAFRGFADTGTIGLYLQGFSPSGDTTKSTGAVGKVRLIASAYSGTGGGANGANENLLVVNDHASARFILDADGDSHQDAGRTLRAAGGLADDPGVGWTNYDTVDDIKALNALAVSLAQEGDPLREHFLTFFEESKAFLEAIPGKPIVTFNPDGHHFVNMSRLTMLLVGAIRQVALRVGTLEDQAEVADRRQRVTGPAQERTLRGRAAARPAGGPPA